MYLKQLFHKRLQIELNGTMWKMQHIHQKFQSIDPTYVHVTYCIKFSHNIYALFHSVHSGALLQGTSSSYFLIIHQRI